MSRPSSSNGRYGCTAAVPGSVCRKMTDGTISATPASLSNATFGVGYSQLLTGTGGTPAYTWSVGATSTLPPGLILNPNGSFGGVPTATGTYSFNIRVADQASTVTAPFSLTIASGPAPVITTASPLPGSVGFAKESVPIFHHPTPTRPSPPGASSFHGAARSRVGSSTKPRSCAISHRSVSSHTFSKRCLLPIKSAFSPRRVSSSLLTVPAS